MPTDRSRRLAAVSLAVLAVAVVAVLSWLALSTTTGQTLDDLGRSQGSGAGRAARYSVEFLRVVSTSFLVVAVAVLLVAALVQRHWQEAMGALVIVAGANVTTQAVKALLVRPDLGIGADMPNSLPSGHTTVAASLGTATLLVAPPRWRPAVAVLAAGYAGAMGAATLYGGWHRPSDALAAIGVVAAWTLVVFAALPLLPTMVAEHPPVPQAVDMPPVWVSGQVVAVRVLVVGIALGTVVAVGGLTLILAGWTGAGAPPAIRYAGPAGACLAAGCLMAWACVATAPPPLAPAHQCPGMVTGQTQSPRRSG